jgi:UDP-N-acetylglucosamine 2-epimerase (non-hydrolysing)
MKVTLVAGARPNFMKIAPIIHAIKKKQLAGNDVSFKLVHTGQHFDEKMSSTFFNQLQIPHPDINLNAGGGTQAEQTAQIMIGFESFLNKNATDLVLVVGDVTSTMACAIVAKKLGIKLAHVEAGIRSNDWSMPEEINRLVTDSITDYFFTTSEVANNNLYHSGVEKERVFFVGNTMIDTLLNHRPNFIQPKIWEEKMLEEKNYLVLTLHRPSNVDDSNKLRSLLDAITSSSKGLPILFPVHPRTRNKLVEINYSNDQLVLLEPMPYLEFNYLVEKSLAVITDSGGITEETTVLGIPCMTLRNNTERPETITDGTNELIGTEPDSIPPAMERLFNGHWKKGSIPKMWDGNTSDRIVDSILSF